jgi:hypothetical protein
VSGLGKEQTHAAVIIEKTGLSDAREASDTVYLKNIGRGPAFNVVSARLYYITVELPPTKRTRQAPQWRVSQGIQTIEASGSKELTLLNPSGEGPVPRMLFDVNPPP